MRVFSWGKSPYFEILCFKTRLFLFFVLLFIYVFKYNFTFPKVQHKSGNYTRFLIRCSLNKSKFKTFQNTKKRRHKYYSVEDILLMASPKATKDECIALHIDTRSLPEVGYKVSCIFVLIPAWIPTW